jgi:hypothetical protein
MAKGFQQKVTYKTLPFIIDTQDLGRDTPLLVSTLLHRGDSMAAEKIPYDDIIKFERLDYVLDIIMVEMSDRLKNNLHQGFYDALIDESARHHRGSGEGGMTAVDAARRIIVPFVEDRFGRRIAEKIDAEVIAPAADGIAESQRSLFLSLAQRVVAFRVGSTPIFSMMFGSDTDVIIRDWAEEYTSLAPADELAAAVSAVDAMERQVLPELENLAGKYMTFRIWNMVRERTLPLYQELPQGDLFLKLAEATLSNFQGFFSDREIEERIGAWHQALYPAVPAADSGAPELPASDAMWRIVQPSVAELLGKYIADKLILATLDKAPPKAAGEQGKFADKVNTLLSSDLIRNLVDEHWIENQRRAWMARYQETAAGDRP